MIDGTSIPEVSTPEASRLYSSTSTKEYGHAFRGGPGTQQDIGKHWGSLAQRASHVPSSTLAYGLVRATKRLGLQAAGQDAGMEMREVRDVQS